MYSFRTIDAADWSEGMNRFLHYSRSLKVKAHYSQACCFVIWLMSLAKSNELTDYVPFHGKRKHFCVLVFSRQIAFPIIMKYEHQPQNFNKAMESGEFALSYRG